MFLYGWLHLAGYALPLDEIKRFRRRGSMTPGHPEFPSSQHQTPGVEATTGPLGAGVGNAVGMALAAKAAGAKYNTHSHRILDHHVIALCGDGCLQEGVSFEAVSFAAHEGLDNLILIYDANEVTLDKMASYTQSENHIQRFEALGWNTIMVRNGHDFQELDTALQQAKSTSNGKPTFIMVKTVIGKGIPQVEGTTAAHGEAGVSFQQQAREQLGLPVNEFFHVSRDTQSFFQRRKEELIAQYDQWNERFAEWAQCNPQLAADLHQARFRHYPSHDDLFQQIPSYHPDKHVATRQSASDVLQHVAKAIPQYMSGSADLHGSTKNYIQGVGDFGNPQIHGKSYRGRNIHYGIREHGMGTILNGIAYYGLHLASGATFLAFADYMRAAIRIAALSELPVSYIFTHDSVGVGEDGPTHQPVETLSSLRVIPNLDVIRPADPEEVAGAFVASIERQHGPTAIILSRQNVPTLSEIPIDVRREGVLRGGYIALLERHGAPLSHILIATGSELHLAIAAAKQLGDGVRVVSIPCMERFDRQPTTYREAILPPDCSRRLAVEAGVTSIWYKYVGLQGCVIGTDSFGFSAPGEEVMQAFGLTVENIVNVAKDL